MLAPLVLLMICMHFLFHTLNKIFSFTVKQRPKLLLGVWQGDYRNWGSMFDFLTSALSMCLAPVPCPLGSSSTPSPTSIHSKPGGCVAGKDYGLASVPHANSHWVSPVAMSAQNLGWVHVESRNPDFLKNRFCSIQTAKSGRKNAKDRVH